MSDYIATNYDNLMQDETSHVMPNIHQFKGFDEYKEERIMTSYKPRAVNADDELFIVFVKLNPNTIIFSLDEVYEKQNNILSMLKTSANSYLTKKTKIWFGALNQF